MNIDEAALKAERDEFEKFARRNFSLGFASDDAVLFAAKDGLYVLTDIHMAWQAWQARALLHRSQPVAVVPAEQAEDSAMLDWLEREHFSLSAIKEPCGDDQFALWWQVTQGRKSISGHPLASPREAIRAAIGRNREAGGS